MRWFDLSFFHCQQDDGNRETPLNSINKKEKKNVTRARSIIIIRVSSLEHDERNWYRMIKKKLKRERLFVNYF